MLFFVFIIQVFSFIKIGARRRYFNDGAPIAFTVESVFNSHSMIQKKYSSQKYFCDMNKTESLGFFENLLGFSPTSFPAEIRMNKRISDDSHPNSFQCTRKLDQAERFHLMNLLKENSRIKMTFGGLPVLSNISGEFFYGYPMGKGSQYNNHFNLMVFYSISNTKRIAQIHLVQSTSTIPYESPHFKPNTQFNVLDGDSIKYEYSIEFVEFETDYYKVPYVNFIPHFWKFVAVDIFIFVLVLTRLFLAKRKALMCDTENQYQVGWIIARNDILRPPRNVRILSSAIGTGVQLLISLILTSCQIYADYTAAVTNLTLYLILFGIIGGFVSNLFCKWINDEVVGFLPTCFLSVSTLIVIYLLSFVYFLEDSPNSLTMRNCLFAFGLCLSSIIMFVAGGFLTTLLNIDTIKEKSLTIPQKIPRQPLYMHNAVLCLFSSVFVFIHIAEPFYVGSNLFWSMKVFENGQSDLFKMIVLLILSSAAVSSYLSVWKIEQNNWKWWGISFWSGASSGGAMFAFMVFYYISKIGFAANSSFVVYILICLLLCGCVALISGGVGVLCSLFTTTRFLHNLGLMKTT